MRKRKNLWMVVFAVFLFAFLMLILFTPDSGDGLDWIRDYGGKESWRRQVNDGKWKSTDYLFRFTTSP